MELLLLLLLLFLMEDFFCVYRDLKLGVYLCAMLL